MTDEERQSFGDELNQCWPNTEVQTALRCLEWCEGYGLQVVQEAMMELRKAMPAHHKVVDPNRLLAICKRLGDGSGLAERTTGYLEQQRAEGEQAERLRSALDAMHVDPADAERAEAVCARKYDACWKMFGPKQKARLMKMELGR